MHEKIKRLGLNISENAEKTPVTLDAFAAALFCTYAVFMYGMTGFQNITLIAFSQLSLPVILGNLTILAVVSLMGSRSDGHSLFLLGMIGSLLTYATQFAFLLFPSEGVLLFHEFLISGSSSILLIAWCERASSKAPSEWIMLLVVSALFTVCLVLIAKHINGEILVTVSGALLVASATMGAVLSKEGSGKHSPSPETFLPTYISIFIFVVGIILSFFSFLNYYLSSVINTAPAAPLGYFTYIWMLFAAVLTTLLWFLAKKAKLRLMWAAFAPLLALGLLAPPYLIENSGNGGILTAGIAFFLVCEITICSIGPSNAKRTFSLGKLTVRIWERSWIIAGLLTGYILAMLFKTVIDLATFYSIIIFFSIISVFFCLSLALLLGRIGVRPLAPQQEPEEKPLPRSCGELAEQYGLTVRETEVLELVAQGRDMPYVRKALNIAPGTSSTHINHIYQKLNVHNRQELLDLLQKPRSD